MKIFIIFLLFFIFGIFLTEEQSITFSYIDQINVNTNRPIEQFGAQLFTAFGNKISVQHSYNHLALSIWTYKSGYSQPINLWNNMNNIINKGKDIIKEFASNYKKANRKIMVSAFGTKQNPVQLEINPKACAQKLADFVNSNFLDGVDISIADTKSLVQKRLIPWLQQFIKTLKNKIGDKAISISAEPLFYSSSYQNLLDLSSQVKNNYVNFFNIIYQSHFAQFITYESIFKALDNTILKNVSLDQLIQRGMKKQKIVIGFSTDTINRIITPTTFNKFLLKAKQQLKWETGVMTTKFSTDKIGKILKQAASSFLQKSTKQNMPPSKKYPEPINVNRNIQYPIKFGYINEVYWSNQKNILSSLGVPGYLDHKYNFLALAFWYCHNQNNIKDPLIQQQGWSWDSVTLWTTIHDYLKSQQANLNSNNRVVVQQALKKKYNDKGIKILVSTFGDGYKPSTFTNLPKPQICAQRLANFVLKHSLDGADIDYQDQLNNQKNYQWLKSFTKRLRQLLPQHIISHAPQAPYFDKSYTYSYTKLEKQLPDSIDFYNVQFYNQGHHDPQAYETYNSVFGDSKSRTSVKDMYKFGVPLNKLVVGKPVAKKNLYNTGLVNHDDLGQWALRAYNDYKWKAGIMYWEFKTDAVDKVEFRNNKSAIQRSTDKLIKRIKQVQGNNNNINAAKLISIKFGQ